MCKNIVLCFDGTGDWAGDHTTNVLRVFEMAKKDDPKAQVVFYDGGIGTRIDGSIKASWSQAFAKALDLALATGLNDKVLAGYQFLIEHYEPGDRIYMFGFSRGAFTARVLAGLIHCFGILRKDERHLDSYFWQMYDDIKTGQKREFNVMASQMRSKFCHADDTKIEFLGLWDTVSSVGILTKFKTFPHTSSNPSVINIRHAVSIDERRNAFPESLYNPDRENLEEVWFPGVHRDVGGGELGPSKAKADVAGQWVYQAACDFGLLGVDPVEFPGPKTPETASKPGFWARFNVYAYVGYYPQRFFNGAVGDFRYVWPNIYHVRPIPPESLIDRSVKSAYSAALPKNLPKHPIYTDSPLAHQSRNYSSKLSTTFIDLVFDFFGTTFGAIFALTFALGLSGVFPWKVPDALAHSLSWTFFVFVTVLGMERPLSQGIAKRVGVQPFAFVVSFLFFCAHGFITGSFAKPGDENPGLWVFRAVDFTAPWLLAMLEMLGVGLLLFVAGQFPWPKLPRLRADFILGNVGFAWFKAAVMVRVFSWLAPHIGTGVGHFLGSFGVNRFNNAADVNELSQEIAGATPSIAVGVLVTATLIALANLVWNRFRIRGRQQPPGRTWTKPSTEGPDEPNPVSVLLVSDGSEKAHANLRASLVSAPGSTQEIADEQDPERLGN